MDSKIILATSSPYRIKAFKALDIEFISKESNIKEDHPKRPKRARNLVLYLSKLKAKAVSEDFKDGIVIGFDSVGDFDGILLEKPKSRSEAYERLKALSRNDFTFYTGIYIINLGNNKELSSVITTKCYMREISNKEINNYLNQDKNYRTYAIGFNPNTYYSSTFIKKIEGSYNNLTKGVPLEEVVTMLMKIGYEF